MRASSRLDRSICGALRSTRTASSSSAPPTLPTPPTPPTAQCAHSSDGRARWGWRQSARWVFATGPSDPAEGTLLPFLLPSARMLRTSTGRPFLSSSTPTSSPRPPLFREVRFLHSVAVPSPTVQQPALGREELLSFVDPPAADDSVHAHLEYLRDPFQRRYAPADSGPEVTVSHQREDAEFPSWDDLQHADEETQRAVHALGQTVWSRLRNPSRTSAGEVFESYQALPGSSSSTSNTTSNNCHDMHAASRMAYIPATLRHDLLKALGMVEKKDAPSMLRYFAVIGDVRDAGFPLWRAEWNAAMSFASRYVGMSTASETEAAVQLWREMEQDAGLPGNEVTFNILFDVASKAGNFALAEMVYDEMEKRGMRFNRYHHVSLIHFFGLKMDADGIRTAYREMVEAGEMIDVVVLNCVMAGFLRCGEEDAAERVYARMYRSYTDRIREARDKTRDRRNREKKVEDHSQMTQDSIPAGPSRAAFPFHLESSDGLLEPQDETEDRTASPPTLTTLAEVQASLPLDFSGSFAGQRAMADVLMMLARVSRGNAGLRSGFQRLVPTRPDLSTYRILTNHYAVRLGDLSAVARYLGDMQTLHLPLQGSLFLALFKGFAMHGGRNGTGAVWSETYLRSIWAALLRALDDEEAANGLYISTWLIVWVLRAFDRCCHSPEAVFKAYNSLTSRWSPSDEEAEFAIGFLHNLLKGRPGSHAELQKKVERMNEEYDGGSTSTSTGAGTGRHKHGPPRQSALSRLGSSSFEI